MSTKCEHDQNQKSHETRWPDHIMGLDFLLWNLFAFEHETHDNDGYWDNMIMILSSLNSTPHFWHLSHEASGMSMILDTLPLWLRPQPWILPHEMSWADQYSVDAEGEIDSWPSWLTRWSWTWGADCDQTKFADMTWAQPKMSLPALIVGTAEPGVDPELLLPCLKLESSTSIDDDPDSLSSQGLIRMLTTVKLRSVSSSVTAWRNSLPDVRRDSMNPCEDDCLEWSWWLLQWVWLEDAAWSPRWPLRDTNLRSQLTRDTTHAESWTMKQSDRCWASPSLLTRSDGLRRTGEAWPSCTWLHPSMTMHPDQWLCARSLPFIPLTLLECLRPFHARSLSRYDTFHDLIHCENWTWSPETPWGSTCDWLHHRSNWTCESHGRPDLEGLRAHLRVAVIWSIRSSAKTDTLTLTTQCSIDHDLDWSWTTSRSHLESTWSCLWSTWCLRSDHPTAEGDLPSETWWGTWASAPLGSAECWLWHAPWHAATLDPSELTPPDWAHDEWQEPEHCCWALHSWREQLSCSELTWQHELPLHWRAEVLLPFLRWRWQLKLTTDATLEGDRTLLSSRRLSSKVIEMMIDWVTWNETLWEYREQIEHWIG